MHTSTHALIIPCLNPGGRGRSAWRRFRRLGDVRPSREMPLFRVQGQTDIPAWLVIRCFGERRRGTSEEADKRRRKGCCAMFFLCWR